MKIVIATGLYPPEIGGPATYARLLEERLPRSDFEVSILPFREVRHWPRVVRHIVYAWKLARMARATDLIFVQDTVSTGFPAAIVSLIMHKPLVARVPGDYAWEQGTQRFGVEESLDKFQKRSHGLRIGLLRAMQRFVVHRARRIIAPSHYLAHIISGWTSHPEKIEVIYNGIEMVDENFSTTRIPNLIVSAGRLVPWKGFEELIDVVASNQQWQLILLGDGPLRDKIRERIEKLGDSSIRLDQDFSRVRAHRVFSEAAVFVLNSRYEGLSHTLIEAMALGTPVIATRVGGNPEVVQDGVNGVLIEAGDKGDLERALSRMLTDDTLRRKMGAAAAKRAADFSIDKTVKETASLLKSSVLEKGA